MNDYLAPEAIIYFITLSDRVMIQTSYGNTDEPGRPADETDNGAW